MLELRGIWREGKTDLSGFSSRCFRLLIIFQRYKIGKKRVLP